MSRFHQVLPELVMDRKLAADVARLHRLTVYGRWSLVGLSWLIIGTASLWGLRQPISLWLDYFTWSAVRYGLAYHRLPAVGLAFCIGLTFAVLLWQSRNILIGISLAEQQRLVAKVKRIHQQGSSHPLAQWVSRQQPVSEKTRRWQDDE